MDQFLVFFSAMIFCCVLLYLIIRVALAKDKNIVHYTFCAALILFFMWVAGAVVNNVLITKGIYGFYPIQFIANNFLAPDLFLTFYFLSKTEKVFKPIHAAIFIVPFICTVFLLTNEYHNLYIVKYSVYVSESRPGIFAIISIVYSFFCFFFSFLLLIFNSVKHIGLFFRQALFISLAALCPVVVQVAIHVFGIQATWVMYYSFVSFIAVPFVWLAVERYDFLRIMPVSLSTVISHVSEGLIILTKDNYLNETNTVFDQMFPEIMQKLKRRQPVLPHMCKMGLSEECFIRMISVSIEKKATEVTEFSQTKGAATKYFNVEVTALFSKLKHVATMIAFKDITQIKDYIRSLEDMNNELQAQNEEIAVLNSKLKEMAEVDALTGAYNRRFFNEYYEIEIARVLNYKKYSTQNSQMDFGIAIMDIDDFKKINDTYGHIVGDDVLKQVVQIIKSVVFSRDIVCRYGGEEFAIIFTKTNKFDSARAAEKIRKQIENNEFYFNELNAKGRVTVSIGLAGFDADCRADNTHILHLADERLYIAKTTGKNKLVYE